MKANKSMRAKPGRTNKTPAGIETEVGKGREERSSWGSGRMDHPHAGQKAASAAFRFRNAGHSTD